ncbi:MAG: SGNH/GDSL hydrolase family protein [Planctomycetes bacterium]|nr:SGNH/GDSL hydrolase family protein [Planctomycetota bacterium]
MKGLEIRRRTLVVLVLYAVLLHVVAYWGVFKTNFIPLARKTLGLAPPEERNLQLYQSMLGWSERDRAVPDGAVVVLGDSLMARLDARALGPDVHVFALGGMTTHTLREALPAVRSLARARAIVLGVGVNDAKYRDVQQIASDYAGVLDALPANIPVLAVPILPVDASADAVRAKPYLDNARLRELDTALRKVSEDRGNVLRLPIPDALVDGAGALRTEMHAGDGWHLSPEGSAVLAAALRAALEAPRIRSPR